MKLKTLLVFNAIVTTLFGAGCVLAPNTLISLFDVTLYPVGSLMMQYSGAWLIGIGLLAWFSRNAPDSEARRAMVMAYFICYSIAFIVALIGQLGKVLNVLGWGTVALNLILATGYAYFQFRRVYTD